MAGMLVRAARSARVLQHSVQPHAPSVAHLATASSQASKEDPKSNPFSKYAWAKSEVPPPSPGHGLLGKSANFDIRTKQKQFEKWEWLLRLLGFMNEDDKMYTQSTRLLQSCVNQTAIPDFYRALRLEPNFRGQQALLMAHVWMVHRRLASDKEEGKLLQELLFDRLWEETLVRIRFAGVNEMTVNKHLKSVQQECFNACYAYDKALQTNTLQNAVASHLLNDESKQGQRIASSLTDYFKREMKSMENVHSRHILEGTIPWGSIPKTGVEWSNVQDDDIVLIGQKIGNWRTALDNRGKLYYWNLTSRYSVWEKPTGDELYAGVEESH